MKGVCTIALLMMLGGCARYEYRLVQPPEFSRHIGAKVDEVVTIEPLEYRLRTVSNRLVMRIFNRTEDPIELLGARSSVVDPRGQSHPLRDQTIAPQSFIKLIFPPTRPRVYDAGPRFGIGVGYHVRRSRYRGGYGYRGFYDSPFYDPYDYGPRYLALYDESDAHYWDWTGQTDARISLVFRRGDEDFRQEFVFNRRKM